MTQQFKRKRQYRTFCYENYERSYRLTFSVLLLGNYWFIDFSYYLRNACNAESSRVEEKLCYFKLIMIQ